MSDSVRINGNAFSWGSLIARAGGERFFGFTKITGLGQTRERQYVWGMGPAQGPRGRSRGKYTPKPVKIGGPVDSIESFLAGLGQLATDGASYGDVRFDFVVQAVEPGMPVVNITLEDCVITDEDASFEEGPEGLEEEITLMPMRMNRGGLRLYDASGGPL
jgi:hypothetical protein